MENLLLLTDRFLVHGLVSSNVNNSIYERINHIITNCDTHELCVSTIAKNDHSKFNYFAPVGLIVGGAGEVTYCRNDDGGTIRMTDGSLIGETEGGFFNPKQNEIKYSIINRPLKRYNEFRIKKYQVIGFYISKDDGELGAVSTIIGNESAFYNGTQQYNLPYYFALNGSLNEVDFISHQFQFKKNVSNIELYGQKFKERVFELALQSININLTQYYDDNKKCFYGVIFNPNTKNVINLFGDTPAVVLNYIKTTMVNAKAGFMVDLHLQIAAIDSSDLLLIPEDLLNCNPIDIDTIIIHELVHYTVNSRNININLNEADREVGNKFYKASGQFDWQETQHNLEFCSYLACAVRNYNNSTNSFISNNQASISSFRYELPDDFNIDE